MTARPPDRVLVVALRAKFDQILSHLGERRHRLYLASEATSIGNRGITQVATTSGTCPATITRGLAELAGHPAPTRQIRVPGADRKPLAATDPGLLLALEGLIEPHPRGDPRLLVTPPSFTATYACRSLYTSPSSQLPCSVAAAGRRRCDARRIRPIASVFAADRARYGKTAPDATSGNSLRTCLCPGRIATALRQVRCVEP